ncbi:PAS domain-containing protein [Pusillimonas sp.]|uniref:PAS domain-containing protein n=1 Tax=Pusillimonas sp. TaxID=3040095 RepID=UPI0029BE0680|nr:PAS domain-containing protein [Pusillimonas sp.]MDX3893938.1 PAS domain-containing protein [Pusillimonas sp.]
MNELDFRLLAEHASDMICLVDGAMKMTYASPACERLLGWKPDEMIEKGPEGFVHPNDLPIICTAHRGLLKHGIDCVPIVVRMRKKTGDYAWMEVSAQLVPAAAAQDGHQIVLVMRDVSACIRPKAASAAQAEGNAVAAGAHRQYSEKIASHIITGVGMYLTDQGRIAFVESISRNANEVVCCGYVLGHKRRNSPVQLLEWLPDGECVTAGEMRHRITQRI